MSTAHAIAIMSMMANERVMAAMQKYADEFINPLVRQTVEILERNEIHERVSTLLGYNAEYDAVRYPR